MVKKEKRVGYAEAVRQLESGAGSMEERIGAATRTYPEPEKIKKVVSEPAKKMPSTLELFRHGKNWYDKKGYLLREKTQSGNLRAEKAMSKYRYENKERFQRRVLRRKNAIESE